MSASAIADGLIALLSAASVLGSTEYVSKNSYQILESAYPVATVIHWTGLRDSAQSYSDRRRTWNFLLRCFVRYGDDPQATLNNVWTYTDKIITALESDATIQGTADMVNDITGNRDPDYLLSVAGQTWVPFNVYCDVVEI